MSKKVLLSIKPVFADRILTRQKHFEFRKTIFKDESVKHVLIYSSSPVKLVVGRFKIEDIIRLDLDGLWEITSKGAGISREFFDEYFYEKEHGYAIKIGEVHKFKRPYRLGKLSSIKQAPQSFAYV